MIHSASCHSSDTDPLHRETGEARLNAQQDEATSARGDVDDHDPDVYREPLIRYYPDITALPENGEFSLDDRLLSNVTYRRHRAESFYSFRNEETGCWLGLLQMHETGGGSSEIVEEYVPRLTHGEGCGCHWPYYHPSETVQGFGGTTGTIGLPDKLRWFSEWLVDEGVISGKYAALLAGKLFMGAPLPPELLYYADLDEYYEDHNQAVDTSVDDEDWNRRRGLRRVSVGFGQTRLSLLRDNR